MYFSTHGGECCGVSHIVGFQDVDKDDLNSCIQDAINEVKDLVDADNEYDRNLGETPERTYKGPFGHLIEITLTDDQMMRWATTLKELGFRLGPRWLNDNSGNYCNLLTWQSKKPSKPRPFTW